MRLCLFLCCVLFVTHAQAAELYSPTPQCAMIKNTTNSTLFLMIRTDFFENQDGSKERFQTTLRLEPQAAQEVCAKGPFFPNYQVDLSIRTLIPIFSCKTRLQGEIAITSTQRDDGSQKFSAECVS
jgi:hypothetical protein